MGKRLKAKLLSCDRFEVKQDDEFPGGTIEGWANTFDLIDSHQEIVKPGAFKKSIAEFNSGRLGIPLMDNHRIFGGIDAVIGKVIELEERKKGLFFKAYFSTTREAQDVRVKVQEGIIDSLSIGFQVKQDKVLPNGIRELLEIKLREISVVVFPANQQAQITGVKNGPSGPQSAYQKLMAVSQMINCEFGPGATRELGRGQEMKKRVTALERIDQELDRISRQL